MRYSLGESLLSLLLVFTAAALMKHVRQIWKILVRPSSSVVAGFLV
jgi:hypothetical protein